MAIAGLLVQVLPDAAERVERSIRASAGLTSYGLHDESCIVVVAESPADELESVMNGIQQFDGVLSVYLTSLHTEDALAEGGEQG